MANIIITDNFESLELKLRALETRDESERWVYVVCRVVCCCLLVIDDTRRGCVGRLGRVHCVGG